MKETELLPASALACAVQYTTQQAAPPAAAVEALVQAAGSYAGIKRGEVTVRFVNEADSAAMNTAYRGRQSPANVLSFDYHTRQADANDDFIFGDIVICADVVSREADVYNLTTDERYAHLIVHGLLHLAGYLHETPAAAAAMEAAEAAILAQFNLQDPYQ